MRYHQQRICEVVASLLVPVGCTDLGCIFRRMIMNLIDDWMLVKLVLLFEKLVGYHLVLLLYLCNIV